MALPGRYSRSPLETLHEIARTSVGALTLVLGGARSGKSRYAEGLIVALPPPWTYLATAEAGDDEMAARIKAHHARRGASWRTIEAPRDLATPLAKCGVMPVLVDCLTLWLSNLLLADADIEKETARLEQALARVTAPVVMVANEVGSGIVPEHALGRFRRRRPSPRRCSTCSAA